MKPLFRRCLVRRQQVGTEHEIELLPLLNCTRSAPHFGSQSREYLGLLRSFVYLSTLEYSIKFEAAVLVDGGEDIRPSFTNEFGGIDGWGEIDLGSRKQLSVGEAQRLLARRCNVQHTGMDTLVVCSEETDKAAFVWKASCGSHDG